MGGEILVVSRLFADHHQRGGRRSLAGHDLSCISVERTARAGRFGAPKRCQCAWDCTGHIAAKYDRRLQMVPPTEPLPPRLR
jgi:hypothetical protein